MTKLAIPLAILTKFACVVGWLVGWLHFMSVPIWFTPVKSADQNEIDTCNDVQYSEVTLCLSQHSMNPYPNSGGTGSLRHWSSEL